MNDRPEQSNGTIVSDRISPRPKVDVGVVTYNTGELSSELLRRLMDSDSGCELRLLVHDNASSDGTVELLREMVPEAEVEAGERNCGFGAAMNSLMARSSAPWFLALNSDAWPEPGAIGTLVDAANAHPTAAAVAPRILHPDGELEHSALAFPSVASAAANLVGLHHWNPRLADRMLMPQVWKHDRPRAVDWAIGACLLMRRSAVESLGGFDERYFMYGEDLEWCWRAHLKGHSIWFEPSAVVRHIGGGSGGGYGDERERTVVRNLYRVYRQHHGAVATKAYWALNVMVAASHYVGHRLRHSPGRTYWGQHLKAHFARRGT